jgi:molybdenum cofactor synthesis domain-containing protein
LETKSNRRAGILTISDKGSQGLRSDESGQTARELLEAEGFLVEKTGIVPDEADRIQEVLEEWADREDLCLILTSGGTGLSPRDVTPQATHKAIDYEIPGIAEAMRAAGLSITPHAMLSRAVSGVRGRCLIINLPGSPKAVRENLEVVLPALGHALDKIAGDPTECARQD